MNTQKIQVPRALLPAFAMLSALVAFGGSAMAASAIVGNDDPSNTPAVDDDGPVTPRVVIASGTSEGFGDWELVVSRDKRDQPCIGLRFISLPTVPKSVSESGPEGQGQSSAFGPAPVVEACGAGSYNQVGNFTASPKRSAGTLFFGRVSDGTSGVRIDEDGMTIKTATVISGSDGQKYAVVETPQRHPEADVVTISSGGKSLGRVDPKAIAATE